MNTGTIIHAVDASVDIESIDFGLFFSTKIRVTSKAGKESTFDILTQTEPFIELLPTRVAGDMKV